MEEPALFQRDNKEIFPSTPRDGTEHCFDWLIEKDKVED